jgi:preprotein translocase subunit SecE
MSSAIYKSGQGYYTRMGTATGAGVLSLLGLFWLWGYAQRIKIGTINQTYIAAAITILVGGVITWFVYDLVFRRASTGDFLIATEGELKKVNWSTRREVVGSTIVVITVMALLTLFVFAVDKIFFWFFALIRVIDAPAGM